MTLSFPRIHGFPIIAVFEIPQRKGYRKGRAILVDRGEERTSARYVVAMHYEDDNEWDHGDYCDTLQQALEAFNDRVERWLPKEET